MRIEIKFKNGDKKIFPQERWDEQGLAGGFYVIKKNNEIVAFYNSTEIYSVELLSEEDIKIEYPET